MIKLGMKIWMVRHGQAVDDLEDRYGGWYDPPLSDLGRKEAEKNGLKLKEWGFGGGAIWSSTLIRAKETAQIVSSILNCQVTEDAYFKERNTYGLLSGLTKAEAQDRYPELVADYEAKVEVLGAEKYEWFVERVKRGVEKLVKDNSDKVLVTHGKWLGAFLKEIALVSLKSLGEACVVEVEWKEGRLSL